MDPSDDAPYIVSAELCGQETTYNDRELVPGQVQRKGGLRGYHDQ